VIAPMPFSGMFALTQEATARGLHHTVRSMFFKRLNGDIIHTIVEQAVPMISPETLVQIPVLGGAMSRVPAGATAFAHRDKEAMVMMTSFGSDEVGDDRRQAYTEQTWRALRPYGDGVYVNFLADDGAERIHEAYPSATYAGWWRSRTVMTRPIFSCSTRILCPRCSHFRSC
jgi:hypothetical protein